MNGRSLLSFLVLASSLLVLPAVNDFSLFAAEQTRSPTNPSQRPGIRTPVTMNAPPMTVAEASNSCEIVSCGMGIKDSCKVTCPQNQTPKCSCDCVRNIGPMCMEHKANCRCE